MIRQTAGKGSEGGAHAYSGCAVALWSSSTFIKKAVERGQGLHQLRDLPENKKTFVWGVPPKLMIEPTNYCNLRCPLCPSGNKSLGRKRGYMDMEMFKDAIDQVRGYAFQVELWNQGESLLHKSFWDMVHYANQAGILTKASTNGHFFSHPELVIESGLDTMIVSLDGATPATYEKYRVGGNFNKVVNGIKAVIEKKKSMGSKTPFVEVQCILFRHNEHEKEAFRNLVRELNADKVDYKTAQIYKAEDIGAFLPLDENHSRYTIVDGEFRIRTKDAKLPNQCITLWTEPVINWDGLVTPCCFDKSGDYPMGVFGKDGGITEIWNNRKFNRFRKMVLTNREKIDICRNCSQGVDIYISKDSVN